MGLELGVDRKQLEAVKGLYRRWTGDAVQFRFLVTVAIMLAIVLLLELPLASRLESARGRRKEARAMSALAHDVRGFVEQVELYDPHVAVSPELVDWQAYVLTQLEHTSATLISLEPKAVEAKGVFQVLEMELVARGNSYREFVDFVARLEHGERLLRVEKVRLEKHQTAMYLTCIIKGLVKSSAAKAAGSVYGPLYPFPGPGGTPAPAGGPAPAPGAADSVADTAVSGAGGHPTGDAEDDATDVPGDATGAPADAGDAADVRGDATDVPAADDDKLDAAVEAATEEGSADGERWRVIANIKRHIVYIALAVLAWLAYSDLDEVKDNAAAATKSPLRAIESADVTAREPDPGWVLPRDPYGLVKAVEHVERKANASPRAAVAATSGAHAARAAAGHMSGGVLVPGPATPGGRSTLHPVGVDLAHWAEVADALAARDTQTCDAPPPEPPPPPPELPAVQFRLHLQATLALADGGQARISGQTVAVGAPLAGLDPYAPPVLASVQGSVAVVRHRGIDYALDLDHRAVIEVSAGGPAALAAAEGAQPAASPAAQPAARPAGQVMGHGGNPRTSNKAPPPAGGAPKAAAPTPATAPAPGAPKKGNYKVRSYPGKPKA